jgi:hypothetical protein
MPGYIDGRPMEIVHSEAIEIFGHLSNILKHMFPGSRWVWWFLPISYPNQIAPNIYSPSEVVILLGCNEELCGVVTTDPSIIDGVKLSISAIYSGEVFIDERIRVVKASIGVIEVIIPYIVHSISNNFWYPLILNPIGPFAIESLNS